MICAQRSLAITTLAEFEFWIYREERFFRFVKIRNGKNNETVLLTVQLLLLCMLVMLVVRLSCKLDAEFGHL